MELNELDRLDITEEEAELLCEALRLFALVRDTWPLSRVAGHLTLEERKEFHAVCNDRDAAWSKVPDHVIQKLRDSLHR